MHTIWVRYFRQEPCTPYTWPCRTLVHKATIRGKFAIVCMHQRSSKVDDVDSNVNT
jgi:hypothetical protein